MLFKKRIKTEFKELIEMLKTTDFKEVDIKEVEEFVINGEEHLAIDQAITQLYEFDIKISLTVYNKIEEIAKRLKIKKSEYEILEKLIR
jgi:hypothetical protein